MCWLCQDTDIGAVEGDRAFWHHQRAGAAGPRGRSPAGAGEPSPSSGEERHLDAMAIDRLVTLDEPALAGDGRPIAARSTNHP
jgi:hypothetical protein